MISPRVARGTPVIVMGISGRVGALQSRLMKEYGTNIVGGVSPVSERNEINGIPIFASCSDAVKATGAMHCVALIAAPHLLAAMTEAVAAGIKYMVTPAEGMPVYDALLARRMALDAGMFWIGPSTPGMAVPGDTKLGFIPNDALRPGPLGVMSKSGTLSYEAGYRLSQRGIGQSVWIGVGGDPVKGTYFADLVPFFAADNQTEALLIIGEIGGHEEEDLATALKVQQFSKPVYALIAGCTAPEGVAMGHAGALIHGNHGSYAAKHAALTDAGVRVFSSLNEMVEGVRAQFMEPPMNANKRR